MSTTDTSRPWQFIYDESGVVEKAPRNVPFSVNFSQHAVERPDSPAFNYLGSKMSFSEIETKANQLANAFSELGIAKGDVVGMQMPNVPQYGIAMLAVAKIGATISNVSPLLAPPELVYQVKNANISTLIALDAFLPVLQGVSEQVKGTLQNLIFTGAMDALNIPEDQKVPGIEGIKTYNYTNLITGKGTHFEQVPVSADDVALIQYTGGTTGNPKGAMLTHGALAWANSNTYIHANMKPGDICASPFPLFHIAGSAGMMAMLEAGCMYLFIPDPRNMDFFIEQLIANPPNIFAAVPALYQMLLAHPKAADIDFSNLQYAISGAAPLTGNDRKKLEAVIGKNKLADNFGMTETCATYVVNPPNRAKPTAVGIPLPGVDVKIVDLQTGTQELPLGEEGEIIVNTPGVMKGYLNLPEESEKTLRLFNGKQYLYSGDIGSMDPEGYITVCDRAKDMLIVGGFKVFSIEVENKLSELDCIEAAAVIATPDQKRPGNDVVNLFVQLNNANLDKDKATIENDIIAFCRANMSPYKVPKVIHFIDQLPLTSVGKLDKKVMRNMVLQQPCVS